MAERQTHPTQNRARATSWEFESPSRDQGPSPRGNRRRRPRDGGEIGGNFGQASAPAWTHNLAIHPAAEIEFHGHTIAVTARITAGAERAMALAMAIDVYPPYATYLRWTMRREVPVFLLERRVAQPSA